MKTPLTLPPYSRREEIWNMISHILGAAFGIVAMLLSLLATVPSADLWGIASSTLYCFTVILLFTVSSLYHGLVPVKAKKAFRVIDHCTIYLLIAGTYTPITLISMREAYPFCAWLVFGIVWGAAILAIVLTAVDMQRFKVFSMICYIAMGWCVILCMKQAILAVGGLGMLLIFSGGVLYTIGAVIYSVGKKKNTPYVHFIFHLFVDAAAVLQFLGIYLDVLQ